MSYCRQTNLGWGMAQNGSFSDCWLGFSSFLTWKKKNVCLLTDSWPLLQPDWWIALCRQFQIWGEGRGCWLSAWRGCYWTNRFFSWTARHLGSEEFHWGRSCSDLWSSKQLMQRLHLEPTGFGDVRLVLDSFLLSWASFSWSNEKIDSWYSLSKAIPNHFQGGMGFGEDFSG